MKRSMVFALILIVSLIGASFAQAQDGYALRSNPDVSVAGVALYECQIEYRDGFCYLNPYTGEEFIPYEGEYPIWGYNNEILSVSGSDFNSIDIDGILVSTTEGQYAEYDHPTLGTNGKIAASCKSENGNTGICVLDQSEEYIIPGAGMNLDYPSWDSNTLYFEDTDTHNLYKFNVDRGYWSRQNSIDFLNVTCHQPAVQNGVAACVGTNGILEIVNLSTGMRESLDVLGQDPTWDASGEYVYFSSMDQTEIWQVNIETEEAECLSD
jgi:hypothetical protein